MVPIILKNTGIPKEYDSFGGFERDFPLICQDHQDEGRALAFAFILYDFQHPQIRKILEDRFYWDALDRISGHYLTVFSFDIKPRGKASMGLKKRRDAKESHPLNFANQFIEKHFGINLEDSEPMLLFFQVTGGKLSKPYLFGLTAESCEKAFAELKKILLAAVKSVKRVESENRGNKDEIFQLIKNELGQRKLFRKVAVAGRITKEVVDLIPK